MTPAMIAYTISWDLSQSDKMNDEYFEVALVKLLVDQGCDYIESHVRNNIVFSCPKNTTLDYWFDLIKQNFGRLVCFQLSKLAKNDEGIPHSKSVQCIPHKRKFDLLVLEIKTEVIESR